MGFTCGIVGLPNVGKSSLFNAITAAGAAASNYPFCTIEPNVGVVPVPDSRLELLTRIFRPERTVPTTLEFVDIAGLVKGASWGEGLGNQFLARIRDVDAVAHVVRCFEDPDVVHVTGAVDPRSDIEIVETELLLKDLETAERKHAEMHKRAGAGDRRAKAEEDFYKAVQDHLAAGRLACMMAVQEEEHRRWLRELHLLTAKPVMYVCNVGERDLASEGPMVKAVREHAAALHARVIVVSAKVEAEVAELPAAEQTEYLAGLGLEESGLNRSVREGYSLLNLLTFFTVNPKEAHAWTLREGGTALDAAATVHSDFARGFIRAEIMTCEDLSLLGSEQTVREHGLMRMEGKEYRVKDGDIVYVRFNV